jgi:Tol biopolymer transport system component/DNA-binding winged helix-turn-helix (wHTH) protein
MKPQPLGPSLTADANGAFYVGDWLVEPELNRIQRNGEKAHLEPKVMEVLVCLSRANGSVVSKEQLIRQVWPDTFVTDDVLKVSIWQLRKSFHDDSKHPKVIETIPKGGYRLLLPVRVDSPGGDSPANVSIANATRASSKRWARIAGVALAVLAVASGVLLLIARWHRQPSLEIVPFTTLPGREDFSSFSPDGNQIAFSYDDGKELKIFVKAIGDEKMLQLTDPPSMSRCSQWSPDGRFIAYFYDQPTAPGSYNRAIYVMTPLGGAKHKIIDLRIPDLNASVGCLVSWSRDSKSVVFADRPSPDEPSGVFIVDIADPKPRRLTTAPTHMDDWDPSISHDGKVLAFIRETDYATRDIYIVPVSGGAPRRLTFRNSLMHHPIWTSDDKRILFSDAGGGFNFQNDIYSVPVIGGTAERLPFSTHDASHPAISPRGDELVYTKITSDINIWRVSLSDSTEPPTKFIASTQYDTGPAFSPDGSKIVFTSDRDGPLSIWICDADGSNPMRLSEAPRGGTPHWSPDGRQIAFDARGKGRSHIYVVPAEGGAPVQLTEDDFHGQVPSWSADGNWIYFSSDRSGSWETWKVSPSSKEAVQVTRHGGWYAEESPDGKFVYYQKPDRPTSSGTGSKPGLWVMSVSGGPEKLLLPDPDVRWHVRAEGIYYLVDAEPHPRVQLYHFPAGNVTTIGLLDKRTLENGPGLGISPDGKTLLYGQIDTHSEDLMLVKHGKW